MQQTRPAAPAVLETLDRLLASETFQRSDRARELLRYLVEREQAGQAERLKGFSIAMDVFGRDAGFNPSTDAVVRVQAGRLRDLLTRYAATEGASDATRIVIPRGSYVPIYEAVAQPCANDGDALSLADTGDALAAQPDGEVATEIVQPARMVSGRSGGAGQQMMRQLRLFWVAMAVIILMLAFLVLRMAEQAPGGTGTEITAATGSMANAPAADATNTITLPPVYISVKSQEAAPVRVAAVLRTGLSGFDTVDFIARDPTSDAPSDKVSFIFEVSTGTTSGSVTIELQNAATGKVLLSRTLLVTELASPTLEDRIADMLSMTIPVSGAIYGYIQQNGLETGLTACLLLNDDYYLAQDQAKHEAAYRCLEKLAAADAKSPLVYAEMASLTLEAVTDSYPYPANATPEQAMALGYRALQMGPTSPYAHRAYGFLNSRGGNSQESIRWMEKAYELNTYDLSMAAAYGYALIFSGDFKTGAPIMEHAVDASSAHPSWWDYGLFLAAFMLGDSERAARATDALATAKRSHYLGARLIAARSTGDSELAAKLVDEIAADHAKFAGDPRAFYVNGKYPPALIDRLVAALRAAGLGRPS